MPCFEIDAKIDPNSLKLSVNNVWTDELIVSMWVGRRVKLGEEDEESTVKEEDVATLDEEIIVPVIGATRLSEFLSESHWEERSICGFQMRLSAAKGALER